jgi:hypothetical protein
VEDAAVAAEMTAGVDAGGKGALAEGVIVRVTVTVAAYAGAGTVKVVAKVVENVDAVSAESALLKPKLAEGSAPEPEALVALAATDGSVDDASASDAPGATGATEECGAAEEPGAADAAAPAPSTPPCAPVAAMRASASGAVSHVMDVPGLFTSGSAACA